MALKHFTPIAKQIKAINLPVCNVGEDRRLKILPVLIY